MVTFHLKGLKLGLLVPHIPGPIPSANDWSQMRWILIGPSADSNTESATAQLCDEALHYSWDVVISDEFFSTALVGDAVNLWLLDVLPALSMELLQAQLLPASLVEIERQGNVCGWIAQQVGDVRQPIIDTYLSSVRSGARKSDDAKLNDEIDCAVRNAWIPLTPQVLKFSQDFLSFMHDFLVARFPPEINFEEDIYVASLWLGESFEIFLKKKTRSDLQSLRSCMR